MDGINNLSPDNSIFLELKNGGAENALIDVLTVSLSIKVFKNIFSQ